jgi:DNA-binding response OmpR family regulator
MLRAQVIIERVWCLSGDAGAALLKNVVYRLRRRIEADPSHPRYLQTVGRQGYILSST